MSHKVVDRVIKHSSATRGTYTVLLMIAERANDQGVAWCSRSDIATRARISERQVKRAIAKLEASGELLVLRGAGRGNTNIYGIVAGLDHEGREAVASQMRQVAGAAYRNGKGDISGRKGDTVSSFSCPEKGTFEHEKGTFVTKKGTLATEKGTSMSPEPLEPSIEPSREPVEGAASAAPAPPPEPPQEKATGGKQKRRKRGNGKSPYADHPAVLAYREVFQLWPAKAQMKLVAERVGDDPQRLELWRQALEAWALRGYSPRNLLGMLDFLEHPERWRDQSRAPPKRERAGSKPRGFSAIEEYMRRRGESHGH